MNFLLTDEVLAEDWGRTRLAKAAFIMTGGLALLWAGVALALSSIPLLVGAGLIVVGAALGFAIQKIRPGKLGIIAWGVLGEVGLFVASEAIDPCVNPTTLTTVLGILLPLLLFSMSSDRRIALSFVGASSVGWIYSTVTDGALFAGSQLSPMVSKLIVGPALAVTVFAVLAAIGAYLVYIDELKTIALRKALASVAKDSDRKGAFLSALSHELITPLNGIVGYSELLEPDNATEYGLRINRLSNGMIQMLQKGLQYGSSKGTFLTVGSESVGCSTLINEVISEFPNFIDNPARAVTIHDPRNAHTLINRAALKIAVSEILENALLYRRPGTDVDVYVSAKHSGGIRIAITNQGQRPTHVEFDNAMKPYERLDRTNGPVPGLGIGLTRANAAITEAGGQIILLPSAPDTVSIGIELPILWSDSNSDRLAIAS